MIKLLPAIISVTGASSRIPQEFQNKLILNDEQQKIAQALDGLTQLEYRVKHIIKGTISQRIISLDATRDDAILLKVNKSTSQLLYSDYYLPFHQTLKAACDDETIKIGIDLHVMEDRSDEKKTVISMANNGDETGRKRFLGGALTCSEEIIRDWMDITTALFTRYPKPVKLNNLVKRSYIIQHYSSSKVPWIRLDISKTLLLGRMDGLFDQNLEQLKDQLYRMITFLFKVEDWIPDND